MGFYWMVDDLNLPPDVHSLGRLSPQQRQDAQVADGLVMQARYHLDMLTLARKTMWDTLALRYQLPPGFLYDGATGLLYLRNGTEAAGLVLSADAADPAPPVEQPAVESAAGATVVQAPAPRILPTQSKAKKKKRR